MDADIPKPLRARTRFWCRPVFVKIAFGRAIDPLRPRALMDLGCLLFDDSCIDMAMAQAVVLYDVYKTGFAPRPSAIRIRMRISRPRIVLRWCRSARPGRRAGGDGDPSSRDGGALLQALQRASRESVAMRRPEARLTGYIEARSRCPLWEACRNILRLSGLQKREPASSICTGR